MTGKASPNKRESFVNLKNARSPAILHALKQIKKDGVCPFCTENLKNYHKNPILKEGSNWLLTLNMYPYEGSKQHFLFISKKHIEDMLDITEDAWKELRLISQELVMENKMKGKTLLIRSGSRAETGSTVTHLHVHLISSDSSNPNYKPIITRVG